MTDIKEAIIKATTELIEENKGDIKAVTARAIAERCDIALGLINYHFKSKDKLIELCVQRIVNKILLCFYIGSGENAQTNVVSKVTEQAKQIMDFFFENKAMAKIFILSDFKEYHPKSNSVSTQNGLKLAVGNRIDNNRKRILAFVLTSAMETAFLAGDCSKEILGCDLNDKEERGRFVEDTVNMLFQGVL
ncbi:MAG: TetR/AcrR family transcriptional regulator [Ruminococcaceae bacterium]|nr:TetR/AcrR family transcriptional regulator [Oscillospiraceae bacterium]MBD5117211.1 TetR/AcrR family transcriptional regulator [Oscillospiraceae bacterium]